MSNYLEFEIGTADLRRGLAAVLPHVNPDRDAPDTHRVRVEVGDGGQHTLTGGTDVELVLMATDGWTAAVYAAAGRNVAVNGLDYLDLHPADVAKILAVFKTMSTDDPDYPESMLRVRVTEKLVTIRDISGLFEGHELELPATPPGQWPRVAMLMGEQFDPARSDSIAAAIAAGAPRSRIKLTGKFLARFAVSAKFVGDPLVFDISRGPLLVQCGDVFAGVINPTGISDDQDRTYDERRASWGRTLRTIGVEQAGRRDADVAEQTDRLSVAVRFIGQRQAAQVTALRRELELGKAEVDSLLADLELRGMVGPAVKGKARLVLFAPEEIPTMLRKIAADDASIPVAERDTVPAEPLTLPVSDEPAEPVESDGLQEFAPVPTSWDGGGTEYPVSSDRAVPDEFYDSEALPPVTDGGPADDHTADPFSDRPAPPDPFKDSDGNSWPTRNPFDA